MKNISNSRIDTATVYYQTRNCIKDYARYCGVTKAINNAWCRKTYSTIQVRMLLCTLTLGELLMGLQSAKQISEDLKLREQIAKERREAHAKARARFSGSLHVEDLEGDLRRTWEALRDRSAEGDMAIDLKDIVSFLRDRSLKDGLEFDEAEAEAQVTALVSALFLTHRGYADLTQKSGRNGLISIKDLNPDYNDFDVLTEKINPKPEMEVEVDA